MVIYIYKSESNENKIDAKKICKSFNISKGISITVNTFIPLKDNLAYVFMEKCLWLPMEP